MEIKSTSGSKIWSGVAGSLREAIEEALRSGADLMGADLRGADLSYANLANVDLEGVDLRDADLVRADLAGANLSRAYLHRTNFAGADLEGANLQGADLRGANFDCADLCGANFGGAFLMGGCFAGAKGMAVELSTPMASLRYQPGKLRYFKLTDENGEGTFHGGITYAVGKSFSVKDYDGDNQVQCGAGISLAPLDWCLQHVLVKSGRIFIAEFSARDIVAIPIGSDGKFRVKRCRIVEEIPAEEIKKMLGVGGRAPV